MWWQDKRGFMQAAFDRIEFLEQATREAFESSPHDGGGMNRVRSTVDWMDFHVEHLSKYIKQLTYDNQQPIVDRLEEMIQDYIQKSTTTTTTARNHNFTTEPSSSAVESLFVVNATLAVLPLREASQQQHHNMKPNHSSIKLLQLAATLTSLWRVGFGRVIVVGISDNERQLSEAAFELLVGSNFTEQRPIQLTYVEKSNVTNREAKIMPRVALVGLQNVMKYAALGQESELVQEWLGTDPDRWEYIYFSEPDLILQTRPSALPAITKALKDGLLMTAHRLEPLPHRRDFPGITEKINYRTLPNHGVFSAVTDLDPIQGDVCCDQGLYHPSNRKDATIPAPVRKDGSCMGPWMLCGFFHRNVDYEKNHTAMHELHHRLLGYPFFTTKGGLGVPMVAANQRVCIPRRGPAHCARLGK